MKLINMLLLGVLLIPGIYSCKEPETTAPVYMSPSQPMEESSEVAVHWANMSLYTIRFSAFNTPTYASRSLGYLGLAMYESIVPGDSTYNSLNGQLADLVLPQLERDKEYHWALSLNASQHKLLKLLYPVPENSHQFIHERVDSLYLAVYTEKSKDINPETAKRSVLFGESIASAIYDWSLTDGGDKAYKRNFEEDFVFPSGPSYWIPPQVGQMPSMYPLHPYWGNNRPFVGANKLPVPNIVPFSADSTSEYYKLYNAVYLKNKNLTQEEKEIAAWWGDDPTETFSPPGHSYYLATVAVTNSKANLSKACETYARVGLAVADAFINCWKTKVTYFNERPSSFIRNYVDPEWEPFWPEPPFPSFPSGHSLHSAAAATVLTDLYGDSFAFTDRSHEGHRRTDFFRFFDLTYPARSFSSFWDAANESAYSRFLGGIHTQQDNDVAQAEGRKVGENVNALKWRAK